MANPPPFDERPFVRIDHGMPEHPKIVSLTDAAFRLWIEALCWCSRQESDGLIPDAAIRRMGKVRTIRELVDAGLLDPLDLGGGYLIHDYLQHNRSRAEIAALRESRADRGARGNHVRWHVARRRFDKKCEHCIADAIANGSLQPSLVRSLNRPNGIAESESESESEKTLISPSVDLPPGETSSSSSPKPTREAANG